MFLLKCKSLWIESHSCFPGAHGLVESGIRVVQHKGSDILHTLGDFCNFEGCFQEVNCSNFSLYLISLGDDPKAWLK